ncbi:MAG: hypothetical protein H6555_03140 [Lewinellaceae bacterium]|nr:hypothetical protein [Lewinellaceae bacterium]
MIIRIALALCLLGFMGCKKDGESGKQQVVATGRAASPITPANFRETPLLTAAFWVFEFYVIPDRPGAGVPRKGTWYRFNPDGTYVGGHWEDQNDYGTWFIEEKPSMHRPGETFRNIFIDSAVDDFRDVEYEIQGVEAAGEVMSWVKTKNSADKESGLAKAIKMLSSPTKQQFGITE